MAFNAYQILNNKKTEVKELLNFEISDILKKIKKRLRIKQSVRNPWRITISQRFHRNLFIEWYKAIRDHSTSFGREVAAKRDRKGVLTEVRISFTDIRSLVYHFSRALDNSSDGSAAFLKKKAGNCKVEVISSSEYPSEIIFNAKSNRLTFKSRYQVTNRYGNITSV